MHEPGRKFEITDAARGAAFTVRVTTRAERAEIAGIDDDGMLRIRLTAASAGDADANDALVHLLASHLGVGIDEVEIVAGQNQRVKLVSVDGISAADLEERLGVGPT